MFKKSIVSLVLMTSVMVAGYAQKIVVTKGQKLETVTTTKMNMEVMGQNINNENAVTNSVEVKEVSADGYLFSNTLKRMTVKGSAMGQDINFDSDKKEDMDGQIGQALKDKIGAVQEIQVNKQGKVTDLKNADDKKAAEGMGDMMNMVGDITKGQAYPLLIQLPAKTLKSGESWTDSAGTAATLKTVMVYTLKGVTEDGALITFTGSIVKSGTVQQNGMDIQLDMTGSLKGEATYDAATGILRRNTTTTDIKGTMGVMGQNAPIAATVTATVVAKKI